MTAELPPPSGPPQPTPDVDASPVRADAASPATTGAVPAAPAPFMPPLGYTPGSAGTPNVTSGAYLSYPGPSAPGTLPYPPTPVPGTNGLAIAALCCGLVGILPIAAVVAIVLGIVALNQLRDRIQRGRAMAVAGIVLGALSLLAWVVLVVVAVVTGEPARTGSGISASQPPSGIAPSQSETFIDDLAAGDCFSGGMKDDVDLVTVVPCAAPHESQVVVVFELPKGPYPGRPKVTKAADDGCSAKADPLITDRAYDELDPSYFYPDDHTWRGDRHVICLVEAPSGTTTGSALR